MVKETAPSKINGLLEGHIALYIGRGDWNRATQMAIAILKSLEMQGGVAIREEKRAQVKGHHRKSLKVTVLTLRFFS